EKLIDDIEAELYRSGKSEVPSTVIGDMVMAKLKNLDYIAYIRFASVYREFADITALKDAVDSLVVSQKSHTPASQLPLLPEEKPGELVGRQRRGRK
ncbi:MAG: ATP cone domain-containing protein, partial [Dehalococcoidia bacterium]|nr:ATP cone domain-containing protein [Dehalococcoidia bacterium]